MDLIKACSKNKNNICEVFIVAEHAVIMIYSRHKWDGNFYKVDQTLLNKIFFLKNHTKLNFGTSMNRNSKAIIASQKKTVLHLYWTPPGQPKMSLWV